MYDNIAFNIFVNINYFQFEISVNESFITLDHRQ